ncbi:MAG: NADH-quinone oxidoreductase subunit J [Bacteroidota bacterium]|nr:NADH-quinone oxidoreductase subunit J [Bacteroidota bacterium]
MSALNIVFYIFMFLSALGAVGILLSRNVFKSALYLLVTLLSVSALFALSYSEFLAVAQILVYAGGITVIIIFGIMLTTRMSGRPLVVTNRHLISGAIVGAALFVLLIRYLPALAATDKTLAPEPVNAIALQIFSSYSLPFELAGLLLLVALIGAAVITSNLKSKV